VRKFYAASGQCVSVFAADFAILVAVAIVETCRAHAALYCAHTAAAAAPDPSREDPPVGTEWQLNSAREMASSGR